MTEESQDPQGEGRHPIGVVARRTGLSPAALRAWERRYEAVVPERSEGGQRLYSDREVERLRLLKEAVEGGRAIGQVAGLEAEELEAMVREDRRAEGKVAASFGQPVGTEADPDRTLARAMEAVEVMAPGVLEEVLRRAAVTLPPEALVDQVLVPLLRRIGKRWSEGELGPASEHLASGVIRRFLEWLVETAGVSREGPAMLVGTPAGQRHELGALLAAVTGALAGWSSLFLGSDLPAEEITRAARKMRVRLVVLSALMPGERELLKELAALARDVPEGVGVVVGGPGAAEIRGALEGAGVKFVPDLPALRSVLKEWELVKVGTIG